MSPALRLSVVANLVLVGIVAVLLRRDHPPGRSPRVPPARPALTRTGTPNAGAVAGRARPGSAGSPLTPAAIARLEEMGLSRDTLINVLVEDLNRRSNRRILELRRRYAPMLVPDREMRELARAGDAERVRELKAAFGEEGYLAWDRAQTLRELNRARLPGDELPMTAGEAEQAYRLQKEFDEKARELQLATEDGLADPAVVGATLAQAQEALDRKLGQLLGPQRFDDLRGTTDPTTEVYRMYGDLNPTPDQAKAVVLAEADYRAREAALAGRLNENPGDAANVPAELKAMRDAQDESLRQIFGAGAYDTMKQQNDPAYQSLQQYAGVWGLKDAEIPSVYGALRAFQDQADLTRLAAEMSEAAGQPVDWRAVNSAVEQARRQAEAGLQNLIGDDRLWRLEQNGVLTVH